MPLTLLRHATLIQKPPMGPLKLDVGNSLANGMLFALVLNDVGSATVHDAIGGLNLTKSSAPVWSGSSIDCNGGYFLTTSTNALQIQAPFSISVRARFTGSNAGVLAYMFEIGVGAGCSEWGGIRFESGNFDFYSVSSGCAAENTQWASALLYDGSWHTWTVTANASKVKRHYFDGALVKTDSTKTDPWQTSAGASLHVGDNWPGLIDNAFMWSRCLSDSEVAYLHAEPYSMFQTRPLQRWFTVVAGGGAFNPATVPWANQPAPDMTQVQLVEF